jgi:predicted permease
MLRLVPHGWRDSVERDLVEEAGDGWFGSFWCATEALAVAVAWHWVFTRSALMFDIRYAIRSMLRAPAFALGAIATFALGIGVNVAVFSAVDRMLFRTLPYDTPSGLVVMGQYAPGAAQPYGTVPATYVVEARQLPAVAEVATSDWNADRYRVDKNPDGAAYLEFVPSSYTMLRVLGVHPILGQDFTDDDARTKRHKVLISYGTWKTQFGGRTDVIGQRLFGWTPNTTGEIAGVLPEDFIPPQVSIPNLTWSGISVTDNTFIVAGTNGGSTPPIVRLRSGVPVATAQAQIDSLMARLRAQEPAPRPGATKSAVRLVPLREALFGRYKTYLALVFTAATLVLLVGCANLASLLLVRARSREHRAAVQLALGASTGRVIQAAVAEALLLSIAGSALALMVLKLSDHVIAAWLPPLFSKYAAPVFASRVLLFSVTLAVISAVVAGVLPGWRSARVDVLSVLQRGGGRVGAGRLRGSSSVLAGEIAVSLVLVACAAITGRNLVGLLHTDVGFDPDRLAVVRADLPAVKDPVRMRQQYGEVVDVLRAMPGIQAAAGADVVPVSGAVAMPIWTGERRGQRWSVTDGFVEAMGMRVVAGRTISSAEVTSAAPVGMLSQLGLNLVWPGVTPQQAVGRFLEFPGEAPRQVVGVVSDVRDTYARTPYPSLYVPLGSAGFRWMMYVARATPGHQLSASEITHALEQLEIPATQVGVYSSTERFKLGLVNYKFRAELFLSFGAVALLLAVIGLYAVQSFNVAMRHAEFGIRIALGAAPSDLWRLLVRQTMRPVLVGVAIGMIVTYWAAQFLQSFLVLVDARDPWTYLLVAFVLVAAALMAVWLPARRAARVNLVVALKAE